MLAAVQEEKRGKNEGGLIHWVLRASFAYLQDIIDSIRMGKQKNIEDVDKRKPVKMTSPVYEKPNVRIGC